MICKKCGNEIKDGEKFCGKCGTKNDGQAANSAQNFCTVKFRVVVPINSNVGAKSFKVRLTGYYT